MMEDKSSLITEDGNGSLSSTRKSATLKKIIVALTVVIVGLLIILIVLAVNRRSEGEGTSELDHNGREVCTSPTCVKTSAYILNQMDLTVDPCQDMYLYACGGWLNKTIVPPSEARWSHFSEVYLSNLHFIRQLLESDQCEIQGKRSSALAKLMTFYKSCMNEDAIDSLGAEPLLKLIDSLGSWTVTTANLRVWDRKTWNLQKTIVEHHKLFSSSLFDISIEKDSKNASRNRIHFDQSGLTLQSQGEYWDGDIYKQAFLNYARTLGLLLGGNSSQVDMKMKDVFEFEKKLAQITVPLENLTDPTSRYNKMTIDHFQEMIGSWITIVQYLKDIFKAQDINGSEEVIVSVPAYFKHLGELVQATDKETLANYLMWKTVGPLSLSLTEAFRKAALKLEHVESGVSTISERWRYCVRKSEEILGFASSALYVQDKFSQESKAQVTAILEGVRQQFILNLASVTWLDDTTRHLIKEKAELMTLRVGYPDWILDVHKLDEYYEKLMVVHGEYFSNVLSAMGYVLNRALGEYGKPPDSEKWRSRPDEVNAFYSPDYNHVTIPAGILQPPFFSPDFPESFTYGTIGMIVGHELTHGFDNEGRMYDKYGTLNDIWTEAAATAYKAQAKCMIDQYGAYKVRGLHLNGVLSLGENIADNGGFRFGFSAFKGAGDLPPYAALPGLPLTDEKLYFLGASQIWCALSKPAYDKAVISNDVHANDRYRVIGSLSNNVNFADVYRCATNTSMNPEKKCVVCLRCVPRYEIRRIISSNDIIKFDVGNFAEVITSSERRRRHPLCRHDHSPADVKCTTENSQNFTMEELQFENTSAVEEEKYKVTRSCTDNPTTLKVIIFVQTLVLVITIVTFIVLYIQYLNTRQSSSKQTLCLSEHCVQTSSRILNMMNLSVDPCEDMYNYACGGWLKSTELPPTEGHWSNLKNIQYSNTKIVKQLLELRGTHLKGKASSAIAKVKAFYQTCMDMNAIEQLGKDPLVQTSVCGFYCLYLQLMNTFGSWTVTKVGLNKWNPQSWSFQTLIPKLHRLNSNVVFTARVKPDMKDISKNMIYLFQSGLTLVHRSFYDDEAYPQFMEAYTLFAVNVSTLLGEKSEQSNEVVRKITDVFYFEQKLAQINEVEETKSPEDIYNKMTLTKFQTLTGSWINITQYLSEFDGGHNYTGNEAVVVENPDYFRKIGQLVTTTSNETLANYFMWHLVQQCVSVLSEDFAKAYFELVRLQTGKKSLKPRWEECLSATRNVMGMASSALFVEKQFSESSRFKVTTLLHQIRYQFIQNLARVTWLDIPTRNNLKEKAEVMKLKVGYPDWIMDPVKLDRHYEQMKVEKGQYFISVLSGLEFHHKQHVDKLRKRPEFEDWSTNLDEANAFYNPNEVVVPAGFLQPPLYSPYYPESYIYGSVGMTVGHELTHGFDNIGRLFDKNGVLMDMWSQASSQAFELQSQCFVNQYSAYNVRGQKLNGQLNLRENIADNGGIKFAFNAFKLTGMDSMYTLPGLSLQQEQLYFVGFSQMWCQMSSPEIEKLILLTSKHTIGPYRVIGALSNSEDFARAFECGPGTRMNPEKKCVIW